MLTKKVRTNPTSIGIKILYINSPMTPKHLNNEDPWMLAEDIPDSDIFFFQIPFSCFTNDSSYNFIKNYTKVIASYDRFNMLFYFGKRDSFEVAESILKALLERDDFGDNLNKNIEEWSQKLIDFAQGIAKLPLSTYRTDELWKVYEEHDSLHTKLYTYGWIPVSVDMFHNNLTIYLKKYLSLLHSNTEDVERFFITLTTPTEQSILNQEQTDFFDIYFSHKDFFKKSSNVNDVPKEVRIAVEEHAEKWGHLGYIYVGNTSPFGIQHYMKELFSIADSNVDVASLREKTVSEHEKTRREQDEIYNQIEIDEKHKNLFRTTSRFSITKLVRRHAQLLDLYLMHKHLLSEISRRLDLTRYQVQFMTKDEVKRALIEDMFDKKEYAERMRGCVYYTEKDFEKVYIGVESQSMKKQLETVINRDVEELRGQPANHGYARGVVKIIIRAKDMSKMNEGDVLVSIATDPDIVPAMKKASAIVTEQGGVTSHAAIVSRELGIPCVIGTKIVTKVFKDGDMVEVDANSGVVRKII